jgi:hypothetical protein
MRMGRVLLGVCAGGCLNVVEMGQCDGVDCDVLGRVDWDHCLRFGGWSMEWEALGRESCLHVMLMQMRRDGEPSPGECFGRGGRNGRALRVCADKLVNVAVVLSLALLNCCVASWSVG